MEHLNCWLSDLLNAMEHSESPELCIGLLKKCGGNCAKRNALPHLTGLREELRGRKDRTEIAEIIRRHTGAECTATTDGFILTYNRGQGCDCALVNGGAVNAPLFCNCTLGFHETLWTAMFERPVTVELLETFLRGGDGCSQKITFQS